MSDKKQIIKGVDRPLVTGVCRSSYMYCTELRREDEEKENSPKVAKTRVLIPKRDKETIAAINKACEAAARKKFGADFNPKSKKFKMPLRDGDEELEEGEVKGDYHKGHMFLNTKRYSSLPQVVDKDSQRIEDTEELSSILVSGYYFRFSLMFKGFDRDGNKGVRCELCNIMFIKEGERLDGSSSAEDDFSDLGEEEY